MGVSNLEEDELETNQADGSDNQISRDEPHTDRESLRTDAFAEGIEDNVIEELASKEEVTLDDLRKIPGAEGLTDSQLTAAWEKAQAEAGGGGQAGDQKVELPFPVYDAQGNKVAPDKVTLADLLGGKLQIGYNAMDKEQRKTIQEVIRNASQGHWNEHRYNTVQGQYKEVAQKYDQAQKEIAAAKDMQGQWTAALNALAFGDSSKMSAILNAYKASLGKSGQAVPEGFVPQEQVAAEREAEARGMQVWTDTSYEIATKYGANFNEVRDAVKFYVEREPNLTQERFNEIVKYDVPMLLESHGYKANGQTRTTQDNTSGNGQPNNEVEDLKRQLAAQAASIAELRNGRTQSVRDKGRKAPSAGSGSTPGAGDSQPTFKSRQQMKEWLQGSDE